MPIKVKITYHPYQLRKSMVVNGWKIKEIIISSHYEEKHNNYMTDELILELVKQLDGRVFIPKFRGNLAENQQEWQSFFWEPFHHQKKAYRLVWYMEIGIPRLWILNCFRRKKYEKKK